MGNNTVKLVGFYKYNYFTYTLGDTENPYVNIFRVSGQIPAWQTDISFLSRIRFYNEVVGSRTFGKEGMMVQVPVMYLGLCFLDLQFSRL